MKPVAHRLLPIIVMVLMWDARAVLCAEDVVGPSVTELTIEQATELAGVHGDLELNHLRVLSPRVAELISSGGGAIMLNGLTSLSPESAAVLSQQDAMLELNGLTELPLDTALALITPTSPRVLWLRGLTAISDEVAERMGQHNGYLRLSGLEQITDRQSNCLPRTTDTSASQV